VASLEFAGDNGSLSDINATQGEFRSQIAALNDLTRQLVGDALTEPGDSNQINPLNAPFVLYVNSYTGTDTFVTGSYNDYDEGTIESKRKIVENQRLVCGYTPSRPFRTINRAIIEAALITSKTYLEETSGVAYEGDLVSIVLMPGLIDVLNGPGSTVSSEWTDGKNPTDNELEAFNPTSGGIILPRGCSLCSLDLRKCIIRPTSVPAVADEAADYSNRRAIFKMTGRGYYYGMTFKDKKNANSSHHLVDCFQFASAADLDEFYGKIRTAFGGASNTGNISNDLAVKRDTEWKIVGTFPADGSQTITSDTTQGASPYIYNCSSRSEWGLCGVFADGGQVNGLRSCVIAQFTGVSLQRDLNCWQKYSAGSWGSFSDYNDYITTDPDDTRMDPNRRSFHIRAINNAIIQEVSVFAIGQGVHHWTQSGGELTITNSNSNFGGCAAISEDYQTASFPADSNWTVNKLRVATDLSEENGNITKIYLGNIADGQDDATIQSQEYFNLDTPLNDSIPNPGVPEVVDAKGYTLRANSYLWIENPIGEDYRTQFTAAAWDPTDPDRINFIGTIENELGIEPGDDILTPGSVDTGQNYPSLAGRRVYIRRLKDSRSTAERRYSLVLNNTTTQARLPVRDYVLQTTLTGSSIDTAIPSTKLLTVLQTGGEPATGAGVVKTADVVVRRNNAAQPWTSGNYYRPGDNVTKDNKHYICVKGTESASFNDDEWEEAYVHMDEGYNNEDFLPNAQPEIIFDNDTSGVDASTTLGYNLSTVWSTDSEIISQYRTATDYLGLHSFLTSIGFSAADAHTILLPKTIANRDRNPGSALDGISAPSGAANSWDNWPVEFRRPSTIRLFGHAYEWAGYLNYTKALPKYQKELGTINKFTYYFTHVNGGRVYASGFNQEGFLVSNKGLEDLATGESLSVEQLGSDEYTIDFPTFYETLAVDDLSVNSSLTLSGQITGTPTWTTNTSYLDGVNRVTIGPFGEVLPALPTATTDQRGVIELATTAEVQEFTSTTLAVTPSTLIQALGDAVKSVVNARLSLSNSSAVPNADQSGSTLYLHPYNGNEIALYSNITLRWAVVRFSGVQSFSLSGAGSANTNYDVYIYNTGTAVSPTLAVEYVAWTNDTTPPTRSTQDGVLVKNGAPDRRLLGVVRTTSAGNSIIDLGGVITGANSANYPKVYLANLYNLYDASAVYFFGNSWTTPTAGAWAVPPSSVYATAPRISFVQAGNTLVTAFLDIYGNDPTEGSITYIAPGIDSSTTPPVDAFYGEAMGNNQTTGSQWARALSQGKHDIYYLYKLFNGSGTNIINEHAAHGTIVVVKV
jgi:hypothetical protein